MTTVEFLTRFNLDPLGPALNVDSALLLRDAVGKEGYGRCTGETTRLLLRALRLADSRCITVGILMATPAQVRLIQERADRLARCLGPAFGDRVRVVSSPEELRGVTSTVFVSSDWVFLSQEAATRPGREALRSFEVYG